MPLPVLTAALFTRFRSREDNPFAERLLAALRNQFGGHAVQEASRDADRRSRVDRSSIFGGGGDLAHRKLLPALYNLHVDGLLPPRIAIVGVGRKRR